MAILIGAIVAVLFSGSLILLIVLIITRKLEKGKAQEESDDQITQPKHPDQGKKSDSHGGEKKRWPGWLKILLGIAIEIGLCYLFVAFLTANGVQTPLT